MASDIITGLFLLAFRDIITVIFFFQIYIFLYKPY